MVSVWKTPLVIGFCVLAYSCSRSNPTPAASGPNAFSVNSSSESRRFEVMVGGKYGFINESGKLIVNPQFDAITRAWSEDPFGDGPVGVCSGRCTVSNGRLPDGKWGYIDSNGTMVIAPQFDNAGPFREGLAAVCVGPCDLGNGNWDGKWGYIDKTGKYVINPQFGRALPFKEGLAVVGVGKIANYACEGKEGYIDPTGRFAINPQFDSADSFKGGLAQVFTPSKAPGELKTGYIDKTGKYVWEPTR